MPFEIKVSFLNNFFNLNHNAENKFTSISNLMPPLSKSNDPLHFALFAHQNAFIINSFFICFTNLILPFSFYAFRDLTYGMSGPLGNDVNATQAAYKWLESWEI